ncbi:MAG: histidine kinase dimerization/phosphoacceptor domain -containing protein, partial [Deferribacterales bacterium]
KPNPYLSHVQDRDIITESGRKLTLVNPAYMSRQVFEMAQDTSVIQTHLTSDILINPVNRPDTWEKLALAKLYGGAQEYVSVDVVDGEKLLRFMRPFITVEGCLKCHAVQGYKVGEIRGGISVSIPLKRLSAIENNEILLSIITHTLIWLIGLAVLAVGYRKIHGMMSELAENKDKLHELNEQKAAILSSTGEAILGLDSDGVIIFANPVTEHITGYSRDELLGKSHHMLMHRKDKDGGSLSEGDCLVHSTINDGERRREEQIFRRKDGELIDVEVLSAPIKKGGRIQGAVISYYDITEQIKNRETIKRSLKEKEILLKEIHHRVKNNLQIISSFLSLQKEASSSRDTEEALAEAESRVMAMALLHQSLYKSENMSVVRLDAYFHSLFESIRKNMKRVPIVIREEVEPVSLPIDTIMCCGLIVNELIMNSIKYAFVEESENPEVVFSFRTEGSLCTMTVSDNGVGYPKGFEIGALDTLGLPIVVNLVKQLGGTYTCGSSGGAWFTVSFTR